MEGRGSEPLIPKFQRHTCGYIMFNFAQSRSQPDVSVIVGELIIVVHA